MKNVEKFIEKISYGESYFLEESNNKVLEKYEIKVGYREDSLCESTE